MVRISTLLLFLLLGSWAWGQSLLLNNHWQFRKVGDTAQWLDATVPGTIHTDLLDQKKITDPFYRDNEHKLDWIDATDWEYQTTFDADDATLKKHHIELVFEGLDTYADVYLNGHKLVEADNMFRTWKLDVKPWLQAKNKLYIYFHSAHNRVKTMASKDAPFTWPTIDYPRMYVRKAQYSFGWDWGPKFTTCGIWKNVLLHTWNDFQVNDVHFEILTLNNKQATVKAHYQIEANDSMNVTIGLQEKTSSKPSFATRMSFALQKGSNVVSIPFTINNPQKWWTYQLGKPYLYATVSSIANANGILEDSCVLEKKLGLRTIELVQEKDEVGQSFYFKLNGEAVYMKGADFIPCDAFLPNIKPEVYQQQVNNAIQTNMNMLRVWGGGIYESDLLYNLCDSAGILIWQDCMFACAMYPDDEAFLKNVSAELADNVTRLRNHPSLAIWCGNNEVDEGWNNWGWKQKFAESPADEARITAAYKKLFLETIPTTIAQYDKSRPYHPSSPLFGWTRPESVTHGDQHYWGMWGYEKEAEIFHEKTGRFISEYGMQSMPQLSTLQQVALPEDMDTASEAMRNHQKHPKGFPLLQSYIKQYLPKPNNFIDYIYATQCVQHYALSTSIHIHRSKMPTNMGTLYWQLNDCWPVASWATVDYANNWKGAMYAVKEAYADLIITIDSSDAKNWTLNITNDLLTSYPGTLLFTLHDFSGKEIDRIQLKLTATKQTNTIIDLGNWMSKRTETNGLYAKAEFTSDKKILASQVFNFCKPKQLKLSQPYLQIQPITATSFYVTSNVYAKYVQLSMPTNPTVHFSDNYFDVLPNERKRITITSAKTTDIFSNKVEMKSLADLMK